MYETRSINFLHVNLIFSALLSNSAVYLSLPNKDPCNWLLDVACFHFILFDGIIRDAKILVLNIRFELYVLFYFSFPIDADVVYSF